VRHLRLGILISGGGTTLENLATVIERGELDATIAVVIASNPTCAGIEKAHRRNLPVHIITRKDSASIEDFSNRIAQTLRDNHVDLALMAGFLSLWQIPEDITVMNIHPALLPKHGGKGMHGHHVHQAVIACKDTESGCTIHFANNAYDAGPIILQKKVPVLPNDTPDTLAKRVFQQECLAYPEAIRLFAAGKLHRP
jgi:formyltetrahydrofolate-dependent phosphoribosylglycinamide formyltransferase